MLSTNQRKQINSDRKQVHLDYLPVHALLDQSKIMLILQCILNMGPARLFIRVCVASEQALHDQSKLCQSFIIFSTEVQLDYSPEHALLDQSKIMSVPQCILKIGPVR